MNDRDLLIYLKDPLYRNSLFLTLARFFNVINSFIFWFLAAKLYSVKNVRIATAFSKLNFDFSLIRFININCRTRIVYITLAIITISSFIVVLIYILGISLQGPEPNCTSVCYVSTDDTTDYYADGTHDEETINQAISRVANYSTSTHKGIVHLNAGTFKTLDQIVLKGNVTLEGNGSDATIIRLQNGVPDATGTGIVNIRSGEINTVIQNLTLDGNKDNLDLSTTWAYKWNGVTANGNVYTLKNIDITNTPNDGIKSTEVQGPNIISNVSMSYLGHSCLYLIASSNITITDITCDDNGNSGLRMNDVQNIYVNNFSVINTDNWGVQLYQEGEGSFTNNVTIENFINKNPKSDTLNGIYVVTIRHADYLWHITNITFRNVILDNNWQSKGQPSLDEGVPPGGVYIKNADNVAFENIIIHNSTGDSIVAVNNYSVQGRNTSHITVKNSALINSTGYGINSTGNIAWNIIYNDIWNNALGNLKGSATEGVGNIYVDPLFADASIYDFHLKSQAGRWNGTSWINDSVSSFLIDAGDPTSDYSKESASNGSRIEIGAYGDTPEASKTHKA